MRQRLQSHLNWTLPAYNYRCAVREVAENCAVLCYYAASIGNLVPTFRDHLSVPSSVFKNPIEPCSPNTDFIEGRFWAVRSLSSVVSASRVVASGWMEGSVVVSAISTTVLYDTV